jgi:clan AA aspartic protease
MADEQRVGVTEIIGDVTGPRGDKVTVKFIVDSGAMYSLLPHDIWQKLGLEPKRRERFSLADGTPIERAVSECVVSLPHGETTTPVILGQPGDVALLGVVTLEELGLVLNPFDRTLHPMRNLLLHIA